MKMYTTIPLILCTLLLLPHSTPAQDQFKSPDAKPEAKTDVTLDLKFQKANFAEACTFIAEQYKVQTGKTMNLVVSSAANKITLPDMSLQGVTLQQFASFLSQLGQLDSVPGGLDGSGAFGLTETDGIWHAWAYPLPGVNAERVPVIFDLSHGGREAMALLDELLKEKASPDTELKFHEASRTLIAIAEQQELHIIAEVLQLFEKRRTQQTAMDQTAEKMTIHKLEMERDMLEKNLLIAQDQLQEALQQMEAERRALMSEISALQRALSSKTNPEK